MKKLMMALAVAAFALSAQAADEKKPTAQQGKMATCNKDAADKKGDERKAFMKACLSAKPAAATTQQSKMKTCNTDAGTKKGDERKAFMKECLSKKA
jgi:psiF repeat